MDRLDRHGYLEPSIDLLMIGMIFIVYWGEEPPWAGSRGTLPALASKLDEWSAAAPAHITRPRSFDGIPIARSGRAPSSFFELSLAFGTVAGRARLMRLLHKVSA